MDATIPPSSTNDRFSFRASLVSLVRAEVEGLCDEPQMEIDVELTRRVELLHRWIPDQKIPVDTTTFNRSHQARVDEFLNWNEPSDVSPITKQLLSDIPLRPSLRAILEHEITLLALVKAESAGRRLGLQKLVLRVVVYVFVSARSEEEAAGSAELADGDRIWKLRRASRSEIAEFLEKWLVPPGDAGGGDCRACFRVCVAGERVACLPCGHRYHAQCIEALLMYSNQCPVCCSTVLK